jgi:hypothetical protein
MRRSVLLVALALLAALVVPASAGTSWESYDVRVVPDPTQGASPYGACGAVQGAVAGQDVGSAARLVRLPGRGVLHAEIAPVLNVFAGDAGLDWTLHAQDRSGHELAVSSGPRWRNQALEVDVARATSLYLVACNRDGHPDATVYWRFRRT